VSEAATFTKVRYKRVLSSNPCSFCRMLAGRGAVYHEGTASFESHDHCACSAEPVFSKELIRQLPPEVDTSDPSSSPISPIQTFETLTNDAAAIGHIFKDLKTTEFGNGKIEVLQPNTTRANVKETLVKNLTDGLASDPDAMAALKPFLPKKTLPNWADQSILEGLRAQAAGKGEMVVNPAGELVHPPLSWAQKQKLAELEAQFAALPETRGVETFVQQNVNAWAGSSNAGQMAQVTQMAAEREFGLAGVAPDPALNGLTFSKSQVEERLAKQFEELGPATRVLLRTMYDQTQAQFAREGITHVRLFRGVSFDRNPFGEAVNTFEGTTIPVKLRPLSSFSANGETAAGFASGGGYVFSVDVPVERILSTARTGLGCLTEEEYVVLGGGDVNANVVAQTFFRPRPHVLTKDEFKAALTAEPIPAGITDAQWAKLTQAEKEALIPF
jgi:hypothetical protein